MRDLVFKLAAIAEKSERRIIGLMSGTSLDGLDIALCRISGHGLKTRVTVEHFDIVEYDDITRESIRQVFARKSVELHDVCLLNANIGRLHAQLIMRFLAANQLSSSEVDLIASHGQTIFHAPSRLFPEQRVPNSTLQLGDIDHISHLTNIITLGDFRQKHIVAGGEGAPLAGYGDYLLFSNTSESRILLNLGGVANISYIPLQGSFNELICTDVGPANTVIDAYLNAYMDGIKFDDEGRLASRGMVIPELLKALRGHAFFAQPMPRTTGPEEFNLRWLRQALASISRADFSHEDILATLVELTVTVIVDALQVLKITRPATVYASGGGVHNTYMMHRLRQLAAVCESPLEIKLVDHLGMSADAKEAVLFAILANECVAGSHATFSNQASGYPNISMGKISLPT